MTATTKQKIVASTRCQDTTKLQLSNVTIGVSVACNRTLALTLAHSSVPSAKQIITWLCALNDLTNTAVNTARPAVLVPCHEVVLKKDGFLRMLNATQLHEIAPTLARHPDQDLLLARIAINVLERRPEQMQHRIHAVQLQVLGHSLVHLLSTLLGHHHDLHRGLRRVHSLVRHHVHLRVPLHDHSRALRLGLPLQHAPTQL